MHFSVFCHSSQLATLIKRWSLWTNYVVIRYYHTQTLVSKNVFKIELLNTVEVGFLKLDVFPVAKSRTFRQSPIQVLTRPEVQ